MPLPYKNKAGVYVISPFLYKLSGYITDQVVEYDILSYAGNWPFANAMVQFRSNSEWRTKKAVVKYKSGKGSRKWRKVK